MSRARTALAGLIVLGSSGGLASAGLRHHSNAAHDAKKQRLTVLRGQALFEHEWVPDDEWSASGDGLGLGGGTALAARPSR